MATLLLYDFNITSGVVIIIIVSFFGIQLLNFLFVRIISYFMSYPKNFLISCYHTIINILLHIINILLYLFNPIHIDINVFPYPIGNYKLIPLHYYIVILYYILFIHSLITSF